MLKAFRALPASAAVCALTIGVLCGGAPAHVLGRHLANNLSLVSTAGSQSQLIGYGHNRADDSFIPGGLVVKPDLPKAKTDWPFLWFENQYSVSTTSAYILSARAAQKAAQGDAESAAGGAR